MKPKHPIIMVSELIAKGDLETAISLKGLYELALALDNLCSSYRLSRSPSKETIETISFNRKYLC
jgi:hypothetical protein